MLGEIERQIPDIYRRLEQIEAAIGTPDLEAVTAAAWADMPSISIDYGVMEGAQQVAMVPLQAGWNDVGSWDALQSVLDHDENKNIVARGEAVSVDSFGNIVFSNKKMVALVGVDDLVIVEDGDTLLIGRMNQMQKVKNVVDLLRQQGRDDLV
jgi:mannose-1-phosphate guanylyltransferase